MSRPPPSFTAVRRSDDHRAAPVGRRPAEPDDPAARRPAGTSSRRPSTCSRTARSSPSPSKPSPARPASARPRSTAGGIRRHWSSSTRSSSTTSSGHRCLVICHRPTHWRSTSRPSCASTPVGPAASSPRSSLKDRPTRPCFANSGSASTTAGEPSFREVLEQWRREGSIPAPSDIEVLSDLIYAPVYMRLLVGHSPLDDTFVRAHLDYVYRLLGAPPPTLEAATS